MKRMTFIVIVLAMLLGCTERREYRDALSRAEAAMNDHPDSALLILDSLGQHEQEFGKHFRMQYLLHLTNAQNKTDVTFTSDSLVKELAEHFDSHGTTNERVLAHYLLGMVYSDMGEAPKAINSFQDAIDAADTTVTEFNFHQLSCVYSQMATIYRRQLLLTNEIKARNQASHYAFLAKQIKWGIYDQIMSAGAYILLNKRDSAEIILKSALDQYRRNGYTQEALRYSRSLIHLLVEQPDRLSEAKALMDQFEAESDLFDEHHELPPSQRQYYYYKGKYFEGVYHLDSAEYCYRNVYFQGMPYVAQDPMYRGLLSVFTKRHQTDSIAKYAQLYCMVNDSSVALKDRDQISQMTATYNYNRSQREAEQERAKAQEAYILLGTIVLIAIGLFIIILVISWLYRKNQKEKQRKIAQLEESLTNAKLQRSAVQEELKKLKEKDFEGMIAEKERQEAELAKTIEQLQAENERIKYNANPQETDHLEAFLESQIAQLFIKKANGKTERTLPSDAEWRLLVSQFSKDMPAIYKSFGRVEALSPMEQYVCILILLKIPTSVIIRMVNSSPQTVSKAKSRANIKLFKEKGANTLENNLFSSLNRP